MMGHRLDMKERLQVFKTANIAKRLKLAFVPMENWEQSYTNHDKNTHSSLDFSHPSIYSLLHIQFGLLGSLSQLPSTGREVGQVGSSANTERQTTINVHGQFRFTH